MNRTMGRLIDEATDEERDALLRAQDMNNGVLWGDARCGCFVTTLRLGRRQPEDLELGYAGESRFAPLILATGANISSARWKDASPALRYPYAVARFGKERVVRALKLRAAAAMTSDVDVQPVEVSA